MYFQRSRNVVKGCVVLILAMAPFLVAQEEEEEPKPTWEPTYWRAELPGGKYVVSHEMITSVGLQEYVMDGALAVTEVTVGTTGSEIARFFYEELVVHPLTAGVSAEVVETIKEQVKPPVAAPVVPLVVNKIYPTTTHAHVLEYRVASRKTLLRLYDSVEESWTKRRSMLFKAETGRKE